MQFKLILAILAINTFLVDANILNFENNEKLVYFKQNTTKCPMYKTSCRIAFYFDSILNTENLYVIDSDIAKFVRIEYCNQSSECEIKDKNSTHELAWIVFDALMIGKDVLQIEYQNSFKNISIAHKVIITTPERLIDTIHLVNVYTFQTITSILMGILLDLKAIVKIIKLPIPVAIGFISQYACMPLLAFLFARFTGLNAIGALALFIYGCCPGGAVSNNWTIAFNGDLDLSVIMTFVSTMGSLVLMPAWIYSLGTIFLKEANLNIPFFVLIMNIFTAIGPCLFGIAIVQCFPKVKPFVERIAKPFTIIVLIIFSTLIIAAKFYVFGLINIKDWFIVPMLPLSGIIISGIIAFLARLKEREIFTVMVETGVQNVGIAFVITLSNFPSPESDIAAMPLFVVAFSTNIILWIGFILNAIRLKIQNMRKRNVEIEEVKEQEMANMLASTNE